MYTDRLDIDRHVIITCESENFLFYFNYNCLNCFNFVSKKPSQLKLNSFGQDHCSKVPISSHTDLIDIIYDI